MIVREIDVTLIDIRPFQKKSDSLYIIVDYATKLEHMGDNLSRLYLLENFGLVKDMEILSAYKWVLHVLMLFKEK